MEEEKESEVTVVTVRCIDMPAPFCDSWRKECYICGEMTWVSASWIGKKIDRIVCEPCWFANCKDKKEVNICITRTSLEEFREWSIRHYGYEKVTMDDAIEMMKLKTGKKIKIVSYPEK